MGKSPISKIGLLNDLDNNKDHKSMWSLLLKSGARRMQSVQPDLHNI